MNNSIESFLPSFLKQSVCASLEVDSSVIESAPNIVILSSNGYLYEVKSKKVVNSLNLHKEVGEKLFCAYLVENEKLLIFYLVLTLTKRLFIIRRWDSHLEITNVYKEVKSFEVNDFLCLGYPQVKIDSVKSSVIKFPVKGTVAVLDMLNEANMNSIAKLLTEKLQITNRHVDELTEEWYSMKNLCQLNTLEENFGVLPIDSVEFSLPMEKHTKEIKIIARWIKIIGDKLALGIKILYNDKKPVSALEFRIYEKVIKDYSYRFFLSNDTDSAMHNEEKWLFSHEKVISSIQPGQEFTIVGAVPIGFLSIPFGKKLQISYYLTSSELKCYLLRENIQISISDVLEYSNKFFPSLKEACSVEDLQAIKTVKSETKLKIKVESFSTDFNYLERVLKESLGFIEVESAGKGFYYCLSPYLNEVFAAVQPFSISELVWKIVLYTSNETQIYFFVNLLYEFLPENATILLDEDKKGG